MRVLPSKAAAMAARLSLFAAAMLLFSISAMAQAQATAADLSGTVVDPNGAAVGGATVTAKNLGTNSARTVVSGPDGNYQFIGLPPGEYEISAGASSFKKVLISPVKLTVGQSAQLQIKLEVGAQDVVVNVSGDDVQLVESTRTAVSNTIDQVRINGLPINERSATGFALTISTVGRDNGRPVGPAPTSGLNIGGQRGRSTLVQVDGADFTDNSINASRSTVSMEAVQEYQVTTNSYMPEFGRATGGIVNVVTKRGGNMFNGNVFGFIRDKSIQAKNAFAPIIDGDPKKKPPYTRTQYGFTIGGPIVRDKTFFFGSFEQRRRQESGFFTGDINQGATNSTTISPIAVPIPGGGTFTVNPFAVTLTNLTAAQVAYINSSIATGLQLVQAPATFAQGVGLLCTARTYGYMASVGGQTALNGASTLQGPTFAAAGPTVCPLLSPLQASGAIGQNFLLSGAPVPLTRNSNGQFVAFRPLSQLQRIFPISEATTYSSIRVDHAFNSKNQMNVRFGYNPSLINGIQDESQNQTLGQNDYSRTGIQDLKDTSFGVAVTSLLPMSLINEGYFNYGRRKAKFDSQIPSVALQIAGTGFIGSNPFSPVDRTENRYQIRDNMTWAGHSHTVKFGADFNWITGVARFDLNFPALFNFSSQACSLLITGCAGPAFTPVQTYGLGFPSVFIEGFGDPNSTLKNTPIAFFGQDTWKVSKRLTVNFGLRYDYEFTQQFAPTAFKDPLTGITLSAADVQTAQDALNVTQGFPRDGNNWAPRLGLAWDIAGDGKTVIRAAGGIFYDHPLLAVSFNSNIADGSQQQQATLLPIGGPASNGLLNAFQVFHGTVCGVGGSNAALCAAGNTLGIASSAQYQYGFMRFDSSKFTGFGPILPFTLHVSKDFQYPEAFQGNLAIERQIGRDMSLSASFITVNAHHLAHPQDVNIVRTDRLVGNFNRFFGFNPSNLSAAAFGITIPTVLGGPVPTGYTPLVACPQSPNGCFGNPVGRTFAVIIPGMIVAPVVAGLPDLTQKVVNPVMANYFRTLGPNYFFISSASGNLVSKAIFDSQLGGSLATAGPINPYADVNAQKSDGNSSYNALNIELKKRFSSNVQIYATYTWSHSIDDSSDLQTLLKPQDNTNFRAERSDSLFDQRHRFVFSGVFNSPDGWRTGNGFHRFMHGFSFAPIVEISSGRPFNILAPGDANGDFQSTNERPFLLPNGQLCQGEVAVADTNSPACVLGFPINGNLGRNRGLTHTYFSVDARLTRKFRIGERVSLDLIAEGFNLFNRFNEAAANPFYTAVNAFGKRAGTKFYSSSTSAFDPRQFQFGMKLNF